MAGIAKYLNVTSNTWILSALLIFFFFFKKGIENLMI